MTYQIGNFVFNHGIAGLTVTATVYESNGTTVVGGQSGVATTEPYPGFYQLANPTLSSASGQIVWNDGSANYLQGYPVNVAAFIWDRLTSALSVVGSIGKLIVDNLDATVSSRSTFNAATDQVVASNMRGTDDALLAANYTAPDNTGITASEVAAKASASGRFVIDYPNSTATQYNDDGTVRTVFDLFQADGVTPATSAETAVERRPQ